jgi:large subunit ribosomal protein L4e
MATARPLVGVYSENKANGSVTLPGVMTAPIRSDIVSDVHSRMSKNKQQAYAVSKYAGHQTSAESWGTGRAVARIPRVSGGGTHRAGQGAFGNMCRKGRMFAPTKTWRRWHRKINVNEKRYAMVSSIAASAVPALVMARGHHIDNLPEIPLVVDNKVIDTIDKASKAVALLKTLNAYDDVEKVKDSKTLRAGQGKSRNRRFRQRRGPLIVYNQENDTLTQAFRNLPGVELANVNRLNVLQLAPGGHVGRFVIWTRDAFEKLDTIYGTYSKLSKDKKDYHLPRPIMANPDLSRIINSDEIQSVVRGVKKPDFGPVRRRNPLRNRIARIKLNPQAAVQIRRDVLAQEGRAKKKADLVEQKRKGTVTPKAKKNPKTVAREKAQTKRVKEQHKKYLELVNKH